MKKPGLYIVLTLLLAIVCFNMGWSWALLGMVVVITLLPPSMDPAIQFKSKLMEDSES